MSKVIIDPDNLKQLAVLDSTVRELNTQKIKVIFDAIRINISHTDFEKLMEWELILLKTFESSEESDMQSKVLEAVNRKALMMKKRC